MSLRSNIVYYVLLLLTHALRLLMACGMFLHRFGTPRPMKPPIKVQIPLRRSSRGQKIDLKIYGPPGYVVRSGSWPKRCRLNPVLPATKIWPVLINFHGGGFTIGSPRDDARWATAAVTIVGAVVISVGYRLAPENHFPTAVYDGADAIQWILQNGSRLRLDLNKIAISGFSAGGNLAFTSLLAWSDKYGPFAPLGTRTSERCPVAAIISWYPGLDYSRSREERRQSNPGGRHKGLPVFLTSLFDAAYMRMYTEYHLDRTLSYLSPGLASDEALSLALPSNILLYNCEFDDLCMEGEAFRARLVGLGKAAGGEILKGKRHGWDKLPYNLGCDPERDEIYMKACRALKSVFDQRGSTEASAEQTITAS